MLDRGAIAVERVNDRSGPDTDFGEPRQAGFFRIVELVEGLVDVLAFLAKLFALLVNALHHQLELTKFARRLLVDLDDLSDLGDREADPAPAQDFLEQPSVCRAEKPRAAPPFGL